MINRLFSGIFGHFLLRSVVISSLSGLLLLIVVLKSFNSTTNSLAAEQGQTLANSTLAASSDAIFAEDYAAIIDYSFNVIKVTPNIISIVYSKRNGEELIISGKQWSLKNKTLPYYKLSFQDKSNLTGTVRYKMEYKGYGLGFADNFTYSKPIFITGKDWGVLTIDFSTAAYSSSIKYFYQILILFTFAAILLSGVFFWMSSRRIRRQISSFEDVAKVLSDGNLAVKAQETAIGEIGVLGKSINAMATALSEKSAEIFQLAQIVEQTNDAFILFNASKFVTFVNDAAVNMVGIPRSKFVGMSMAHFTQFFDQNVYEILNLFFFTSSSNHDYDTFDSTFTKVDESKINVEIRLESIFNEQDDSQCFFVVLSDITKRKQAELLLQDSEYRWKFAIEGSGDGVWDWNIQTNEVQYSSRWKSMLGYSSDEIMPTNDEWASRVHPDDQLYVKGAMQAYLDGISDVYVVEYRLRCKDDSYKWILGRGMLVSHTKDGKPLRMIGTHTDITERKLAETNLRISATAFESQEGMIVTDANSVILRVNNAFTTITGYSAEEAIGQTPKMLSSGRQEASFFADMWNIINNIGHWDGELYNRRKNGEVYPQHLTITAVKDADGVISNYVATLNDITSSKEAAEKIHRMAFYDPLTKLPNRRLLMDRLNQAIAASERNNQRGALLFLDLDYFKTLNDTLGHNVGDLLLQQVAARLTACVRVGDTVARIGGDEFVVLLENLSEQLFDAAAQTEVIGNKILASLNQPYQLASHKYNNSPSIGATLFHCHELEIEELLIQADIAMYDAKKAGRNTLRFFDPVMQEVINERVEMEQDLRKAIENKEFQLYYQLQVDSAGYPLGVEALIRWHHPKRGLVSPFNFIPLAEEIGFILPIGLWVLETACAQLKAWEQNELTRDLTISINVSAKQFHQVDFVAQVQAALQRHAIKPMLLKLELTESMLVEHVESIIIAMRVLQSIGVRFELDDFGTGYSSLQYLKKLPLHQLKIDQSFIRDIASDSSDQAIVRTIIVMAKSLNLEVIAEGVETEQQRQLLLNNGCKHYQGYLFSKPLPVEELEALLATIALDVTS